MHKKPRVSSTPAAFLKSNVFAEANRIFQLGCAVVVVKACANLTPRQCDDAGIVAVIQAPRVEDRDCLIDGVHTENRVGVVADNVVARWRTVDRTQTNRLAGIELCHKRIEI